ncbi:hypothetical protein PP499_gp39 [Gordonia phage Bjanes7]|uniref:Uncharacterized protein n=5 Tax=Attisvirus TaxID=2169652 RepID=A0A7T3KBM8_9CAUD|nr:hypothetical protein PP494_gp35 [Gordonia phage Matteo]YP_010653684.1 hypothetical protein PP497_gp38 [Gordonia phage Lamberg]YP_010653758.1 hypothetical protein PP498_gp41 [Gordonia phage Sahara]YP_010653828.1 hypothetical protein PP499_gp39 [Gordonia phage Bjanes7]YP_010653905.1 hypothetical protein PP500_gp44 [Gordonia phage Ebert]AZS12784.1 hypothetical protein SEA_SPROUTIE_42 [Gordonia phage Sproutie]AZS12858.1 hypothetical protein SEA_SAVAGE_42 [Gordonia phage Savage]QCW22524.1 hypo
MLFEKTRMRRAIRGLDWMDTLPLADTSAQMIRIRTHAGMFPISESDGALLVWGFDEQPGAFQFLVVRLTEREADRVFAADPYTVGVLEPVRRRLRHRHAILVVQNGPELHARPLTVPRWGSEQKFIDELDAAAASCPAFRLAHRKSSVPGMQSFAEGLVRELSLA